MFLFVKDCAEIAAQITVEIVNLTIHLIHDIKKRSSNCSNFGMKSQHASSNKYIVISVMILYGPRLQQFCWKLLQYSVPTGTLRKIMVLSRKFIPQRISRANNSPSVHLWKYRLSAMMRIRLRRAPNYSQIEPTIHHGDMLRTRSWRYYERTRKQQTYVARMTPVRQLRTSKPWVGTG